MPKVLLVFSRAEAGKMHTNKLLEEHDSHANDSALPTAMPKAIEPGLHLELELIRASFRLQFGMPLNADFMVESNLGSNFAPFLKDTRVVGGELAKLS